MVPRVFASLAQTSRSSGHPVQKAIMIGFLSVPLKGTMIGFLRFLLLMAR